MKQRLHSPWRLLDRHASIHHQRFMTDLAILAGLTFLIGCLWFTVGRWIALGAWLMFLPKLCADAGRLLDVEILRDRLGMPVRPGRHSGAHPRPGARNKA